MRSLHLPLSVRLHYDLPPVQHQQKVVGLLKVRYHTGDGVPALNTAAIVDFVLTFVFHVVDEILHDAYILLAARLIVGWGDYSW